jgi:hypothetical protein
MTTSVGGRPDATELSRVDPQRRPAWITRWQQGRDLSLPPVTGGCRAKTAPEQREKTQVLMEPTKSEAHWNADRRFNQCRRRR